MKFPEMRNELIVYLKGLSDLNYQQNCWINALQYDCFDFAVHFLFDDTDLYCDPESWINVILKDKKEAELVGIVCAVLDKIFKKYGTELSDKEYMELSEWKDVLSTSKMAHNYCCNSTKLS